MSCSLSSCNFQDTSILRTAEEGTLSTTSISVFDDYQMSEIKTEDSSACPIKKLLKDQISLEVTTSFSDDYADRYKEYRILLDENCQTGKEINEGRTELEMLHKFILSQQLTLTPLITTVGEKQALHSEVRRHYQESIKGLIHCMESSDKIEQTLLEETSNTEDFICQLRILNAQNEQMIKEIHRMGGEFHEEMATLKIDEKKDQQDYLTNMSTIDELSHKDKCLIRFKKAAEEKLFELKAILKESENEYACLFTEFNRAELKHKHIKDQHDVMKHTVKQNKKQLLKLEDQIQKYHMEKKEKSSHSLKIDDLRDHLKRCEDKKVELEQETCLMRKQLRSLKRKLDSFEAKICAIQPLMSNYKVMNRKLKNNTKSLEDEIDNLKQKLMKQVDEILKVEAQATRKTLQVGNTEDSEQSMTEFDC